VRYGTQRKFLAPAAGRKQAHADLDEADIAFERDDRTVAMHDDLAASAKSKPGHRGNGGNHRVLEGLRRVLKLLDELFYLRELARHQLVGDAKLARRLQRERLRFAFELPEEPPHGRWLRRLCAARRRLLEIRAHRKRRLGRPD